jgi:hypothetical protein
MTGRWRFDPYKNFNFRVVAAAAVAGGAAFAIARKLLRRKKKPRTPEADTGARPIPAVGTSTAGFVGTAPEEPRPGTPRRRSKAKR